MSAVQRVIDRRECGQQTTSVSPYASGYASSHYPEQLSQHLAPGMREIIHTTTGMDWLLQGRSSQVTCAHCGNTFAKRPELSCPGCAGHEFK